MEQERQQRLLIADFVKKMASSKIVCSGSDEHDNASNSSATDFYNSFDLSPEYGMNADVSGAWTA